jgi:hypothetical protein
MNRGVLLIVLSVALLGTGGCRSKEDTNAAIRDGIIKYFATKNGLNVNNMDIALTQANVHGDTADASVEIRPRNSDPNVPPMQMAYEMEKQGDEWIVIKSQSQGGMQHPAPGEMQGDLPSGHPETNGTAGQMPANHPDFNSILDSAQPQGQQAAPHQPSSGSQQQKSSASDKP